MVKLPVILPTSVVYGENKLGALGHHKSRLGTLHIYLLICRETAALA